MVDGIKSLNDVIEYIKSYININKQTVEDLRENRHYNTIDAKNIKSLVAPVLIKDDNSTLSISIQGDNNAPIIITPSLAMQMRENADFVEKVINGSSKEAENLSYKKVLIQMHKTTDSIKKVRDFAYCDAIIQGKAIATICENEEEKLEILKDPYNNYFLVDIEVVKASNEIKLYRVVKLHNIVPKDE